MKHNKVIWRVLHMDQVIKKRNDLINFFFNEDKEYSKEEVLNKEFAVLTFSPNEEYIDFIKTPYDDMCIDLDTYDFSDDVPEMYIKGIIIDIDNKRDYSIIHVQNKSHNISISCSKQVVFHYSDVFDVGTVAIVKCHLFNHKIYAHFFVDLRHLDKFSEEVGYMNGKSRELVDKHNIFAMPLGLVCQATYFTSKKGTSCLRLLTYTRDGEKTFIACNSGYGTVPENIKASDFIEFKKSKGAYINAVKKVRL